MKLNNQHTLHLLRLNSIPIYQQLKWEEAILRADQRNWCLINRGSPPAIVMGISGKAEQLICYDSLKKAPIPVIRRFSGGGTVIVDENTLFITLICQSSSLEVSPFPRPIMQWTADNIYAPLFSETLFELKENDYISKGKKWGGNAQSILKGRWLHHSSLLWDFNPKLMQYLLLPPKMPEYRKKRSHHEFLCRLSDLWTNLDLFEENILNNLSRHFQLIEMDKEEICHIANLPHRKVTNLVNLF